MSDIAELEERLALSRRVLDACGALDIAVLDVRRKMALVDYMLVASGGSRRQVLALADKLVEAMKRCGVHPVGVESDALGEWILVDLGDIVVHLMYPETRDYYRLEALWSSGERPENEA